VGVLQLRAPQDGDDFIPAERRLADRHAYEAVTLLADSRQLLLQG